jgi:hypothetical protein
MKLTQFLKPDLKRIIVLLVILIPLIKFFYPSAQFPAQFYLWDTYINVWGTLLMIPFIIVSMILFGGFDVGGGLFPYSNISDTVTYLIGIVFWYVISCAIATGWNHFFKSLGKNSKKYEKAMIISLLTVFVVLVIIMPTIATSSIVMEKTTRQNISMDELLYLNDLEELYLHPEKQPIEDVRLQEIRIKNNFIFPASYQFPNITACLYDTEGNSQWGYSVEYKTEDGRYIEELNPSNQNVIIVQPNTETRIYLCSFGLTSTMSNLPSSVEPNYKPNYENYDQLLLITNVGMNNYVYGFNATEEDILRSEKIKILK